jgi:hypothetical protein
VSPSASGTGAVLVVISLGVVLVVALVATAILVLG